MRKTKNIFLILALACMFLVGCGNNIPEKKQITEDLSKVLTTINVSNPFTTEIETEQLEITNLEIEKSQTTDSTYTAYCIVDMENDYYRLKKYIVCEYLKYDGGVWELNNWIDYQDTEYSAYENPFSSEEAQSIYLSGNDYSNIEFDMSFEENRLMCNLTYDVEYLYKTHTTHIYDEYYFNGSFWENTVHTTDGEDEWKIVGYWILEDSSGYPMFEMEILSFDSDTLSGTGCCNFGSDGSWKNSYYIEDAVIEMHGPELIIMFNGDIDSSILGLGNDIFIRIEANEARAFRGADWRNDIKLEN